MIETRDTGGYDYFEINFYQSCGPLSLYLSLLNEKIHPAHQLERRPGGNAS